MKKFLFPSVFVLSCLAVTVGCAGLKQAVVGGTDLVVTQVPPVDANEDGIVDAAYIAWAQQFSSFPLLPTLLGVGGSVLAIWSKWDSSKNKKEIAVNKQEIALTDVNVKTVADAANVPDHKLV